MSNLFKPYEGKRPYIFISYPHKQSDAVVDTIRILHEKKYRLWYDEGIPAGSDWPANIAMHMRDCEAVICFISNHFLHSQNCFSEIRAAVQLKKPILVVYLDDSVPDGEWKPLLDGCKSIPVLNSAQERARAILSASFVRRRFRRTWLERVRWGVLGLVMSLMLFAASAAMLTAVLTGYWSLPQVMNVIQQDSEEKKKELPPVKVDLGAAEQFFAVTFPDVQQEKAIRGALGKDSENILAEDLIQIKQLYFCGNMVLKNTNGIAFDPEGNCRVHGARVVEGAVRDLELVGKLVYLEELALVAQPVSDFADLKQLVLLRELNLAGSAAASLESLDALPSLEVLHLEHTKVKDLGPLDRLPRLTTVYVSRDMLPLTWNADAQFDVVLVK